LDAISEESSPCTKRPNESAFVDSLTPHAVIKLCCTFFICSSYLVFELFFRLTTKEFPKTPTIISQQ